MHGIILFPFGLAGVRALSIFILEGCIGGDGWRFWNSVWKDT